jgi:hypothetical protein
MKIKSNPTQTVLTITIGFLAIGLLLDKSWASMVALWVGTLGLLSSYLAIRIEQIWHHIAKILSYMIPNILMTLLFYLFLLPIALLNRVFSRKNALQLNNPGATVWISNSKIFDAKSMENPW